MARTSVSHPIRVDWAHELASGGRLGLTFAPGKKDAAPMSKGGAWDRDLAADLERLRRDARLGVLISLVEDDELRKLGIQRLVPEAVARGIELVRFPIRDQGVPSDRAAAANVVAHAIARLREGARVAFHCRGGLGRAGTMAACTLVELGIAPLEAIAQVRKARDGAIENPTQERFIEQWREGGSRER